MRSMAMIRRASITAAMSISMGQRVVQASHEAHSQIACDSSTSSSAPRCTSRMTWLGRRSMSGPIGQPVRALVALEACADRRAAALLDFLQPGRCRSIRQSCLRAIAIHPQSLPSPPRLRRLCGASPCGRPRAASRRIPSTVSRSRSMRMPNSRSFSSRYGRISFQSAADSGRYAPPLSCSSTSVRCGSRM